MDIPNEDLDKEEDCQLIIDRQVERMDSNHVRTELQITRLQTAVKELRKKYFDASTQMLEYKVAHELAEVEIKMLNKQLKGERKGTSAHPSYAWPRLENYLRFSTRTLRQLQKEIYDEIHKEKYLSQPPEPEDEKNDEIYKKIVPLIHLHVQ